MGSKIVIRDSKNAMPLLIYAKSKMIAPCIILVFLEKKTDVAFFFKKKILLSFGDMNAPGGEPNFEIRVGKLPNKPKELDCQKKRGFQSEKMSNIIYFQNLRLKQCNVLFFVI